jgi:exodeoxyribonuclease VII large subunit
VTAKRNKPPQLDLLFGAVPAASAEAEAEPAPLPVRRGRERRTWLVRQLVSAARELVETDFGDVWVEGEISNCRPASSGHLYFTLKDAEAQLPVVLFRRQALLLRFRPEDGLHVCVRGKVTVYEQRGQLQLVAETMEPVGAGSLQLAFEQLRDRLKAEGLFDQDRKRPLPLYPRTVAIITSPSGAVIRDFLNIANRRHAGLCVILVPVAVQGDAAPVEIEAALLHVNSGGPCGDVAVVVLARGGGSMEDLAAFNSERVARAIAASSVPVVSAIGHETDFTIADFVADLRAPTPSAAAELITEAQFSVAEHLVALENRLDRGMRFQLLRARQRYAHLPVARIEQRMTTAVHRLEQRLDDLAFRLEAAMTFKLRRQRSTIAELHAAILHQDPRRQLSAAREALAAWKSRLDHALDRRQADAKHRTATAEDRLYRAAAVHFTSRRAAIVNLSSRLQSLSPLAVLQRGYAVVQDESGVVIRSVNQLIEGQQVRTRIADGAFPSRVESTRTTP